MLGTSCFKRSYFSYLCFINIEGLCCSSNIIRSSAICINTKNPRPQTISREKTFPTRGKHTAVAGK